MIPSYTVKLGKDGKRSSYGFAYVEFLTREQVEEAVKELNGSALNGKKLIIKAYQIYRPYQRSWWKRKGSTAGKKEPIAKAKESAAPCVEPHVDTVAKNRILISNVRGNITEVRIEHFLKDYNPSNIYICKNKKSIMNPMKLTSSYFSVLATIDSPTKKFDEIIKSLKSKKLNGRRVELKPATPDEIKEIEKAAIAPDFRNPNVESIEQMASLNSEAEQASPAIPMELDSQDPTSMIVSPGLTISSNFDARINSP